MVFNISFDIGDKVYLLKKTQIAHLKTDKTTTKVFSKYTNFANIFSLKLVVKLSEHMSINNYIIKLSIKVSTIIP